MKKTKTKRKESVRHYQTSARNTSFRKRNKHVQNIEEDLEKKNRELETLAEISDAFSNITSENQSALELTVKKLSTLYNDACIIRLLSNDGERMRETVYYHPDEKIRQSMHELFGKILYDSITGSAEKVVKEGKAALISEIKTDDDFQPLRNEYGEYWRNAGVQSVLMVPLQTHNKTLGMISLFRTVPDCPYTKQDQIFVTSVAAKLAMAIFNSKLLKDNTREIIRRIRVQQALESQQELLQGILSAIPVGVWVFDQDGNKLIANKAVKEIWCEVNYNSPKDLVNYKAWWTDSGEEVKSDEWAFEKALKGESTFNQRMTIRCFDGREKTILNSAVPIFRGNEIIGAVQTNIDITGLQILRE